MKFLNMPSRRLKYYNIIFLFLIAENELALLIKFASFTYVFIINNTPLIVIMMNGMRWHEIPFLKRKKILLSLNTCKF